MRLHCWWSFPWGSSIYWWISSLAMTSLCNSTLHPQWHFSSNFKNYENIRKYGLKQLSHFKITDSFLTPYNISSLQFCDGKIIASFLSNHFLPNNPKKARTKSPNKFEKYISTQKTKRSNNYYFWTNNKLD